MITNQSSNTCVDEIANGIYRISTPVPPAVALADGETLCLGDHVVEWIDTPHFPHAWECGHIDQLVEKLCKRTPRILAD